VPLGVDLGPPCLLLHLGVVPGAAVDVGQHVGH
jgi:hypothetical protein